MYILKRVDSPPSLHWFALVRRLESTETRQLTIPSTWPLPPARGEQQPSLLGAAVLEVAVSGAEGSKPAWH